MLPSVLYYLAYRCNNENPSEFFGERHGKNSFRTRKKRYTVINIGTYGSYSILRIRTVVTVLGGTDCCPFELPAVQAAE